ncbi:MAG: hypothetical protein ACO1NW_04535 [Chitinophagaceae bacterium]
MKKLTSLFLILCIAIGFTGCYEMSEEYTIAADNSVVFDMNMDMGKLFEMVAAMGGEEEMKKNPEFASMQDTTIYFKSFTDTASDLTAEQKALLENGKMTMKMKMEEKIFKMNFQFPYKTLADLNKTWDPANQESFAQMMNKVFDKKNEEGEEEGEKKELDKLNMLQNIYKTNFTNGKIERTLLDGEAMEKMKNDESFAQIKQMSAMLGEVKISTIIRLPRPAKKVTGEGVELSADKRTVTVKYALDKMIEDPKSGAFTLEY